MFIIRLASEDDRNRTGLDYLNGAYADYSYDAASRLLALDNQTNNGQHRYAYTYDDVGNRLTMAVTDNSGTRTHVYSYDNIYQITEVDYPPELAYLATDTEFHYDAAGNRTSVIDGGGTCNYTTNNLNQYTAAGPTNFSYDSSGNMTHDANFGYAYDPENRLLQVTKSGGSPPDALAEALDSGLIFITDGNNGGWSTEGGTWCRQDWDCASGSTCDEGEDWLQTTVQGAGTLKFWWKVSSETWDVLEFYIDDDCKDSISGEQAWAEKTYTISGAGTHTLRWRYAKDASEYAGEDRAWVDYVQWTGAMEEPDSDDWSTLNYVYDPAGRRVEKKYDGRTVLKYIYDGDHCIAEYGAGNDLHRKYIYGPAVDEPICMIESTGSYAGTYYYHFDALGSCVALTDSDANTVDVYEYDVYGRVGMLDANHPNRFLFTGREYDKETGLYYYRARYYNPQIGRFLQTDPIGYGDGMNLYRYCANNPLLATDPSGETFVLWPPLVPVPRVDEWVKEWWYGLMKWASSLGRPDYPGDWDTLVPFVRWYFWGSDAITGEIDLARVGLLEEFQARISEGVRKFEIEVLHAAEAFAREMRRKGGDMDSTTITGSITYDFAPGVVGYVKALAKLDPFFVLGSGSVSASATIRAERVSANTAKWTATIEYDLQDSFEDPLNPTNKPGHFELAGGKPYPITAHWESSLAGTVTVN